MCSEFDEDEKPDEQEPLFQNFEEQPVRCQAVRVSHANIHRIAAHYSMCGYRAYVAYTIGPEVTLELTINDARMVDGDEKSEPVSVSVKPGMLLTDGDPPTVSTAREFFQTWRRSGGVR